MAGIYQRDNINYGGMLGNAMRERANQIQRDYENYMKQPMAWANAVNQSGQAISQAFNQAAQYQYNKDQLAAQQQFQSEQNAKNLAEQLNRAREQQKWQAEQNRLQRESTEKIAGLNRQNTVEERAAQNVMNYQNAVALQSYAEQNLKNVKPGSPEWFMAQRDLQYAKNKVEYYGGLVDEKLRMPAMPAGTKEDPFVISGPEAEEALMNENWSTEEPETEWQRTERHKRFNERLKTPKNQYTDAIKKQLLEDAKDEDDLITKVNNLGKTVEERRAGAAAALRKADDAFQKMSDAEQDIYLEQHPKMKVVNGHLAYK
jgi:hypothetical protein